MQRILNISTGIVDEIDTGPVTTTVADVRDNWRNLISMSRKDFCLALNDAGILDDPGTITASRGDWPAAFDGALIAMSTREKLEAQVEWSNAPTVKRNHPLLGELAAFAELSDEQLDVIFGWIEPVLGE